MKFNINFGNLKSLEVRLMASLKDLDAKIEAVGEKVVAESEQVKSAVLDLKTVISVLQAKLLQAQAENTPVDYSEQMAKLQEIESKVAGIYEPEPEPEVVSNPE